MKSETILKLSYPYTMKQAQQQKDKWIGIYQKIAIEHPSIEELAMKLSQRVIEAFEILMSVSSLKELPDIDNPLGNEEDMLFASQIFDISDIALIQLGFEHEVRPGLYSNCKKDDYLKRAFLHELAKQWYKAYEYYKQSRIDNEFLKEKVHNRMKKCLEEASLLGKALFDEAKRLETENDWKDAWYPLYQAIDLNHPESLAHYGYMHIKGLGVGKNVEEGFQYLTQSADMNCDEAIEMLIKLYDEDKYDLEANDIMKRCKEAAKRSNTFCINRLAQGFDLRDKAEIYLEKIEQGDIDSLWYLANLYQKRGDDSKAIEYYVKALEANQIDMVMEMAESLSDANNQDFYNIEEAKKYYRIAADLGNEKALLALGKLELVDTDINYWKQAEMQDNVSSQIVNQHQKQYQWEYLASEGGCIEAMKHISIASFYGYPCLKNIEKALSWALKASEKGDAHAIYLCGIYYEEQGKIPESIKYYEQASEQGVFESMVRLIQLSKQYPQYIDSLKANRYKFLSGIGRN